MKSSLYGFLFAMWTLIIIGGGIMVILLGPFTIQQFGNFHWIIASGIKVSIALILVCLLYTSPSPRDRSLSRMPSSA